MAGGETSDFGDSQSTPAGCRVLARTELDVASARALGLESIERDLRLIEQRHAAPFHWGFCDEECHRAGGAEEDTRISLRAEALSVYRTTRERLPDAPESLLCGDDLEYLTVIELATEDGRLFGRFYARLTPYSRSTLIDSGSRLIAIDILPDLRNFEGWQEIAIDLDRPHWAAITMWLELGDDGFHGVLLVVANYTDDDARPPNAIFTGSGGFWPSQLTASDEVEDFASFPPRQVPPGGAELVALDDYAGSASKPTCDVSLSIAVYGSVTESPAGGTIYGDFQAVDASVRVNGVALQIPEGPTPGAPPIPWRLGRLAADSSIEVDVRSTTAEGIPSVTLDAAPFSATDQCEGPGCTAHVEHRLTSYCSN